MIEQVDQVPIGKEIKAQHRNQIRKGPAQSRKFVEIFQQQDQNQSRPDLNFERFGAGEDTSLGFEVLPERFEKNFNLSTIVVNRGNYRESRFGGKVSGRCEYYARRQ
ncbi:MAG: hypothetical protein ACREOO_22420 [bacterium]